MRDGVTREERGAGVEGGIGEDTVGQPLPLMPHTSRSLMPLLFPASPPYLAFPGRAR